MFCSSARVSPCSAFVCVCSFARFTWRCPSTVVTEIGGFSFHSSRPSGPLTATVRSDTLTSTPVGIGIIFRPMRDIVTTPRLPDVAEHFAAEIRAVRFLAGHHALRRGQNRDAHAAHDAGQPSLADVYALPRLAGAWHAGDGGLPLADIAQL